MKEILTIYTGKPTGGYIYILSFGRLYIVRNNVAVDDQGWIIHNPIQRGWLERINTKNYIKLCG